MRISFEPTSEGRHRVKGELWIRYGDGSIKAPDPQADLDLIAPRSMARVKLKHAAHFLQRVSERLDNQAATIADLDAFLGALAAVQEHLENDGKGKPGFAEWMERQDRHLWENPSTRCVRDLRNRSQHQGLPPAIIGGCLDIIQGRQGHPRYRWTRRLLGVGDQHSRDMLPVFEAALATVSSIIEEAYALGFLQGTWEGGFCVVVNAWRERQDGVLESADLGKLDCLEPTDSIPWQRYERWDGVDPAARGDLQVTVGPDPPPQWRPSGKRRVHSHTFSVYVETPPA